VNDFILFANDTTGNFDVGSDGPGIYFRGRNILEYAFGFEFFESRVKKVNAEAQPY
jgi:hypothetical protein